MTGQVKFAPLTAEQRLEWQTNRLRTLIGYWESMAGPANSVYEQCARDLRQAIAASDTPPAPSRGT